MGRCCPGSGRARRRKSTVARGRRGCRSGGGRSVRRKERVKVDARSSHPPVGLVGRGQGSKKHVGKQLFEFATDGDLGGRIGRCDEGERDFLFDSGGGEAGGGAVGV